MWRIAAHAPRGRQRPRAVPRRRRWRRSALRRLVPAGGWQAVVAAVVQQLRRPRRPLTRRQRWAARACYGGATASFSVRRSRGKSAAQWPHGYRKGEPLGQGRAYPRRLGEEVGRIVHRCPHRRRAPPSAARRCGSLPSRRHARMAARRPHPHLQGRRHDRARGRWNCMAASHSQRTARQCRFSAPHPGLRKRKNKPRSQRGSGFVV